jgi:enterobacterial common antigen flippase
MTTSLQHVFSVAFARSYGALISIITLIISARYLGPEGRGVFVAAIAWMSTFCTIFHLSIGPALQYRIQQNRAAYTAEAMLGTLLGLGLVASIIAWAAAAFSFAMTDGSLFKGLSIEVLVLVFASLPLLMWEQYAPNIYASLSRMNLINRAQYIGRTLGVVAFVVLVGWLNFGVAGALVAMFITQAIVMLAALLPMMRSIKWRLVWLAGEVKPLFAAGMKLHLVSISALLLDQASILISNNYLTKTEVGLFQLALQLVGLLLILPQSALMILYGDMAKSDPARYWPHQRKLILRVMVGILLLALAGWLLAPYLIPLVAGEQFKPSVPMFMALLPSLLGLSLSILLTPQWLGRGLFMLSNAVTFTALLIVVIGTFWAVPRYGIDGAINVRVAVYAVILPMAHLLFWRWCSRQSNNLIASAAGDR